MEKANTALTDIHKVMPIERVEELMDDVVESIDYQAEIDRAMAGSAVSVDEESLEAELQAMERAMLETTCSSTTLASEGTSINLPGVPITPVLPIAPTTTPVIQNEGKSVLRDEGELVAT